MRKSGTVNLRDTNLFYDSFRDYFYDRSSQRYSSWVYDCMDIWGKHFAKVGFRLYEVNDEGTLQEIFRHPIIDIFSRPNDFQSWWEIKYRIAQHFAIYGNSYFLKLRDRMNVPRAIIQLQPGRIEPISSEREYISYYRYFVGTSQGMTQRVPLRSAQNDRGGFIKLNKNDIIHLRYPDPDNLIKGRPVIANILDQNEVDILQTAYQKKFYKNGGFLGMTFTTEQELTQGSFDRAKQQLSEAYGGLNNAFKVALFEKGLKPIKAAYSIRDMEIKTQRELTRDEISAAFQVNQFLMGMGELINRATAQTALFQFISGVIDPLMYYIDDVLTKNLAHSDFGEHLFIKHDISNLRDVEKDLEYYKNGLELGWLTINEVRKWEDLQPI